MSLLATFDIPAEAVSLGRALAADPGLRVELERVVPVERTILPFFWVWGGDPTAYERALREEPVVRSLTRLDSITDGTLYRAEWNETASDLIHGFVEADAALIEASGTIQGGRFEVRFPDREAARAFQEYCATHGIAIRAVRIQDLQDVEELPERAITGAQREALRLALERGYFDRPRGVSLRELGEELGISAQAVGGRIRRGTANLLRTQFR